MTRTALGILAALALTCGTAAAQAARTGPTFSLGAGSGQQLVLTPDAAYDYVHDRYFTVHGHGLIEGVLSASNGGILAVTTPINANRLAWAGEYAQTPRVAFSPDVNGGAGGYLVTWHETVPGGFAQVRGRLVSADGVAIGGDIVISLEAVNVPTTTNWTMGPAVAYSTQSHEFLVTWMGSYTASNDIRCNRLNASGVVLQAAVTPVTTASPDWERDPDVVYNNDTDEFLIVYAGYHNVANYAYVAGQRVKAGTGQLLGGSVEYDQIGAGATYIPAVAYNSQSRQYLAVWYHRSSTVIAFYGIKINADGTAASGLIVESSIYKAYDALGLKYNQVSGDYLVVTHSTGSEDAAISIKPDGTPYDNGFLATSTAGTAGAKGNFNPRLATSTRSATYQLVTASGFSFIGTQFIVSGGAPPPPPPTTAAAEANHIGRRAGRRPGKSAVRRLGLGRRPRRLGGLRGRRDSRLGVAGQRQPPDLRRIYDPRATAARRRRDPGRGPFHQQRLSRDGQEPAARHLHAHGLPAQHSHQYVQRRAQCGGDRHRLQRSGAVR